MTDEIKHKLGILAFGSLIDNPGQEISDLKTKRIDCETPFNVEFARKSSATRGNAPTLIPVEQGGRKVKAIIIVLPDETDIENAKSILWRRETGKINSNETYRHSNNPSPNKVNIEVWNDLEGVRNVLYTSIRNNIGQELTGKLLADLAIESILSEAGKQQKDGVRYLLSAKRNGIVTELSEEYENLILVKTETKSLEEAIEKLDTQRRAKP